MEGPVVMVHGHAYLLPRSLGRQICCTGPSMSKCLSPYGLVSHQGLLRHFWFLGSRVCLVPGPQMPA